jgi:hypothetical protein
MKIRPSMMRGNGIDTRHHAPQFSGFCQNRPETTDSLPMYAVPNEGSGPLIPTQLSPTLIST